MSQGWLTKVGAGVGARRKLSFAEHLLNTRNFNSKRSVTGGFLISHGMFRSVTVEDRRSGSGETFFFFF